MQFGNSITYKQIKQGVVERNGTLYHMNKEGEIHNLEGPAVIREDGSLQWYIKNRRYDFESWCKLSQISGDEIVLLKLQYGSEVN